MASHFTVTCRQPECSAAKSAGVTNEGLLPAAIFSTSI